MRSKEEISLIFKLYKSGLSQHKIAKATNISRGTIKDYVSKFKKGNTDIDLINKGFKVKGLKIINDLHHPSKTNKTIYKTYSYLLGMYLGDGSLTKIKNKKDLYLFRIHQDAKYPNIIEEIKKAIITILPENKVCLVPKKYNDKISSFDICTRSKLFLKLFPSAKSGRKHTYSIILEKWQKELIDRYPKQFLRGLIQSDGSRYKATYSKNSWHYNFVQKSDDIFNLFLYICNALNLKVGFRMHTTTTKDKKHDSWIGTISSKNTAFLDTFIGPKS